MSICTFICICECVCTYVWDYKCKGVSMFTYVRVLKWIVSMWV